MAITKDPNVQEVCSKSVTIGFADIVQNVAVAAIDIPPNSVILSGHLFTTQAWNSTTSDVLDVGDAALGTRYITDGAIRAASGAQVALIPTGFVHTGGPITVTHTAGTPATATTGSTRLTVTYVTLGKADSSYEY